MLEPLSRILTYVFLVLTMLSIGLTVTGSEILADQVPKLLGVHFD